MFCGISPGEAKNNTFSVGPDGGRVLSPMDTVAPRPRAGRVTAGLGHTPAPLSGPFGDTSGGRWSHTLHTLERTRLRVTRSVPHTLTSRHPAPGGLGLVTLPLNPPHCLHTRARHSRAVESWSRSGSLGWTPVPELQQWCPLLV